MPNALANETSPYLLQHAENPVNWEPWNDSAFERARNEDKLIFLSIGYSTCHWCHVMAHESFENEEIAKVLNHHFICIKVDREEQPDIDSAYMQFVQASTGQGGWPMSVWLTPDGHPVFGGTYFPPADRQGRPGFTRVCNELARVWRDERDKVELNGQKAMEHLRGHGEKESPVRGLPGPKVFGDYIDTCESMFDPTLGGFGGAPKFPRPVVVRCLMQLSDRFGIDTTEGKAAWDMSDRTLRAMAAGGMHDHLGGGFHRYSVDRYWHVPHYEKMLYDQAQLAMAYMDAWEISSDPHFKSVTYGIFDYLLDTLRDENGAIHAAEDADSLPSFESAQKREGAYWTWTADEISNALDPKDAAIFCAAFGLEIDGNARPESDPHGELKGENTLYHASHHSDLAETFDCDEQAIKESLEQSIKTLRSIREKRPAPHRDDKIVTAWNGLAIGALARGGRIFADQRCTQAAAKIANFIKDKMWKNKTLFRSFRKHCGTREGFPADYTYLISGLIELNEADEENWLEWAHELQQTLDRLFWDAEQSGYIMTPSLSGVPIMTLREDYDGAEPASNHLAAENLLKLTKLLSDNDYKLRAESLIRAGSRLIETQSFAGPLLLSAYDRLDREL